MITFPDMQMHIENNEREINPREVMPIVEIVEGSANNIDSKQVEEIENLILKTTEEVLDNGDIYTTLF